MRVFRSLLAGFLLTAACGDDTFVVGGDDSSVDVASPDGSVADVQVEDTSHPADAVGDAIVVVDASPPPFSCSPLPAGTILCTKFEGLLLTSAVLTDWTGALANSGGNGLDTTQSVSPSHSYLAVTKPADAGATFASLLKQDFTAPKTLLASVMVRVHSIGPSQRVSLLSLGYPGGMNGSDSVAVTAAGGHFVLDIRNSSGLASTTVGPLLTIDAWTAVELDLTPPPSAKVSMSIGGVVAASASPILDTPSSNERDAFLGIVLSDSTAVDDVNFDDFLLRGL